MKASAKLFIPLLLTSAFSLTALEPVQAGPKGYSSSYSVVTRSKGRLGAKIISISPDLRKFFGSAPDTGILVDEVLDGTPAAKAGLRAGDVIVEVESRAITEVNDIRQAMADKKAGEVVTLKVLRHKKITKLKATLDSSSQPSIRLGGKSGGNWGSLPSDIFGDDDFFSPFGQGSFPGLEKRMKEMEERLRRLEGKRGRPAPKGKAKSKAPKIKIDS